MGWLSKKISQETKDIEVYADLDKLIDEGIHVKFRDKIHYLKPLRTEEYYALSNALAKLWSLQGKKDFPPSDVTEGYFNIIHSVCETITLEDVKQATRAQLSGLYTCVMDHAYGRTQNQEDFQKKTLQMENSIFQASK